MFQSATLCPTNNLFLSENSSWVSRTYLPWRLSALQPLRRWSRVPRWPGDRPDWVRENLATFDERIQKMADFWNTHQRALFSGAKGNQVGIWGGRIGFYLDLFGRIQLVIICDHLWPPMILDIPPHKNQQTSSKNWILEKWNVPFQWTNSLFFAGL